MLSDLQSAALLRVFTPELSSQHSLEGLRPRRFGLLGPMHSQAVWLHCWLHSWHHFISVFFEKKKISFSCTCGICKFPGQGSNWLLPPLHWGARGHCIHSPPTSKLTQKGRSGGRYSPEPFLYPTSVRVTKDQGMSTFLMQSCPAGIISL